MAAAASSLRLATRCRQCRMLRPEALGRLRTFTTSTSRLAENPDDPEITGEFARFRKDIDRLKESLSDVGASDSINSDTIAKLKQSLSDVGDADSIDSDSVTKLWKNDLFSDLKTVKKFDQVIPRATPRPQKPGFFALGKKKGEEFMEDPEPEGDVSGMAHQQLEQHREFRQYARLIAWEMPLLTKMAKPFEPPNSKQVLRFRYTSYMGEQHPAEKKVVVEFCPQDMPNLTPVQTEKLKKLVGPRYNPQTDIIKMSSEMFESQAQNKRYLGDLVDTLLKEARDPTDTFEDIPLDTRHHPIKVKPKFPFEWRMTPARQAELEASRQKLTLADEERARHGKLIDGLKYIQNAAEAQAGKEVPEMIMAPTGTASRGRGRTLAVRR